MADFFGKRGQKKKTEFELNIAKSQKKAIEKLAGQMTLDDIITDKSWKSKVKRQIAAMIKRGANAREILSEFEALASARLVLITLFEKDSKLAVSAGRDILDRISGKAVENKKTVHEFQAMDDKHLDAMIKAAERERKALEDKGQIVEIKEYIDTSEKIEEEDIK